MGRRNRIGFDLRLPDEVLCIDGRELPQVSLGVGGGWSLVAGLGLVAGGWVTGLVLAHRLAQLRAVAKRLRG